MPRRTLNAPALTPGDPASPYFSMGSGPLKEAADHGDSGAQAELNRRKANREAKAARAQAQPVA